MQSKRLDGVRVAIIVADDFEQAEFVEPRKALEQEGANIKVVAPKAGQITGMNHDVKADTFKVDATLDEVSANDFDAIMLPGGALNADFLRVNQKAQDIVKEMDATGRPIAFICHAPWLLVSAGCVKGRTLTSYQTIQDDIRNAGGNWVDQEVVRDRNWVSSRSPKDLAAFNSAMVALLEEHKKQQSQQRENTISA